MLLLALALTGVTCASLPVAPCPLPGAMSWESDGIASFQGTTDGASSPILLPTSKANDYPLTSADGGVLFDIDADGVKEQIAWTQAGAAVAFLALDRNGNGAIDDGRELFGGFIVPGARNGFMALTALVGRKGTGTVTNEDELFAQLLLWTDSNHDGISQPGELQPLGNLYSEISLGYAGHNRGDEHGNLFRFMGSAVEKYEEERKFLTLDKRMSLTRRIYDVFFVRK